MKKYILSFVLTLILSVASSQCQADFTYTVSTTNPLQVTFSSNSTFPSGSFAFSYAWYVWGNKVDSINPVTTITFSAAGTYKIKFHEKACIGGGVFCQNDTVKFIDVGFSTGIKQNTKQTNLIVYPNPTIGPITIKLDESDLESKYFVVNQLGQIVMMGEVKDVIEKIDMTTLSSGIYFLTIKNKVVKIMKG